MRIGYAIIIEKECAERIRNNQCPYCALPKSQWKRRTDWRCCSTDCTQKFEESKITRSWAEIRMKAIIRDNYMCVKCKVEPTTERVLSAYSNKEEVEKAHGKQFRGFEERNGFTYVRFVDESLLIGDHILPIALGGDEFDIDNVQTLCKVCNKVKTAQDLKNIALQRKSKNNLKLN